MISLSVQTRVIHLSPDEQSLAAGSSARNVLREEFLRRITQKPPYTGTYSFAVPEAVIEYMVRKYSEQTVYQPLNELRFWFSYRSGAYLQPGYPPLYYSRAGYKTVSPNNSAIAGLGEAVAGLLSQRIYRCRKLSRPNHDFPDIVMEGDSKTYLVEAKATLESSSAIKSTLEAEVPRMATYLAACAGLDPRPVTGLLVGTYIRNETDYDCYLTEITV